MVVCVGLTIRRIEAPVSLHALVGSVVRPVGVPRTLELRAHSARFRSLRQQPFGEVQALLRLAQFLPQVAHLDLEHLEPSLALAPGGALP